MEKHRCKLCSRSFANGRALGGHMKGHLAAQKHSIESASSWSSSSSSSQSEEEEDDKFLIYTLRENPKKSFKLADPEFSSASAAAIVQDRESETESRNPTRKRSKRTRKSAFLQPMLKKQATNLSPSPPVSSISDASSEEDVAMCLIMLSRDKWTTKQGKTNAERHILEVNKFECEKCKKKFRSSKALAGHKATHAKNRDYEEDGYDKGKIFECPFCFKVFGSGQALGGHKRSHLLLGHQHANANNASSSSTAVQVEVKMMNAVLIDLNFPAPAEDDDEFGVVSQAEIVI